MVTLPKPTSLLVAADLSILLHAIAALIDISASTIEPSAISDEVTEPAPPPERSSSATHEVPLNFKTFPEVAGVVKSTSASHLSKFESTY